MRKLIENPSYMTYDEIERAFYGFWVFITRCNFDEYSELLGGVPVAVADSPFKGQRDGFYDKFLSPEYEPRTGINLDYDNVPAIKFFFDPVEKAGATNESAT